MGPADEIYNNNNNNNNNLHYFMDSLAIAKSHISKKLIPPQLPNMLEGIWNQKSSVFSKKCF